MNSKLNKELVTRSLQLASLAEMHPDDRIARIVWDRIQDDLEQANSMVYGMHIALPISLHSSKLLLKKPNTPSLP